MADRDRRDENVDNAGEKDDRQVEADVEVRNAVDVGTASSVVQAGTINGGIHHHAAEYRLTSPGLPVPRQLLSAPHGFVGRVDHLADLDRRMPSILSDGASEGTGQRDTVMVVITAIGGTGGIGKTWLALTWAHRNLHRFPDGQLFVDLHGFSPTEQPVAPATVLSGFLDALGVDRAHQPTDPDRRAELYRSLVADKRMLIVLDNAATTDQVAPLLPGGSCCTVIITSRNHLRGLVIRHGARPIHLDVLTHTEAHALLTTTLGHDRAATERQAITELIELCGGFPLALGVIAARAAAEPHLPLQDTVAELRALGLEALDSEDPTASLSAVLSWSLRHLTDQQRQMFALLGIAPGPDTGLPAAAALADLSQSKAYAMLRILVDASLVNRTPGGRYAMHDLVRAYATNANNLPAGMQEAALRRVLDFYIHTAYAAERLLDPVHDLFELDPPAPGVQPHPLPDTATALDWFDTEHACLLAAQHTAIVHHWQSTAWQLAWVMDTFLYYRGHLHDRLTVWQAANATTHPPDPTTHSFTYLFLGLTNADLGLHDDAIRHLHHALTLAEHHHIPDLTARVHRALARIWRQRGDYQQSLIHARHALTLIHDLGRPVMEAYVHNEVSWTTAHLGDYDTARRHGQIALTLHRRHQNPMGEADTLDSLGYVNHHTGHHTQAINHYHDTLALYRSHGYTYAVADTLDQLGHPHIALNQHRQARTAWREALQLYKDQGRHDDVTRVQHQLNNIDTHNDA